MPKPKRLPAWNAPREVIPNEHQEQVLLVQTIQRLYPVIYFYMTAIPNGGLRNVIIASKLKAEGVKPGYPDIVIDCPRGPYHGLRVEMKRAKKSLSSISEEQKAWGKLMNEQAVLAVVARGCQHALDQILYFWSLGPFDPVCHVQEARFELLGVE